MLLNEKLVYSYIRLELTDSLSDISEPISARVMRWALFSKFFIFSFYIIFMAANRKGHRRERELLDKLNREGFVAHRIAGSGKGEDAICDLIAVKNGKTYFFEVKSRKKIFYTKSHRKQLEDLVEVAKTCGAKPQLAVKLNYKDWQFFDLSKKIPKKIS